MKEQKIKIGTIVSLDLLQINAQLTSLGFDFIFIDLEHGKLSDETISSIILAKKENSKVFIRIASIDEANIKHALDLACDGIIAPRVECISELKTLVDYSFYPPKGKRSVGFCMANKYGLNFNEYTTNFKPFIFAQIESEKGLAIVNEVVDCNDISGVFMGPYDLSASLGVPGEFESEIFKKSYNRVRNKCRKEHKLFGTFVANHQNIAEEIKEGTNLIAVGLDANLILNTYLNLINKINDLSVIE
ncbi:HpcH/HpaI aldolase family protein [Marinifilum sp. RC60d5]|uniref:HpcH/HpaI aldolase family protein n=1 Tax=Marinifilum sp. RC60d5 TaxID=3458414 RepID=UPI0040368935